MSASSSILPSGTTVAICSIWPSNLAFGIAVRMPFGASVALPIARKQESPMFDDNFPIVAGLVRDAAHSLTGSETDYSSLLESIGDAHTVLIGEASHGTHEFYRQRAWITQRLILERGFTAVAVEADWPDAYRVNKYVRGQSADPGATEALAGFKRFPAWMWRNADVLNFIGWLRAYNDTL